MEAPVPASALIHSATLVSAGIFLLLRFYIIFELSIISIYIVSIVGSITAFYGGFISMFQSDTKKILAYSTISHCGFLMLILSTGVIEFVLLYLYIHGFFKAAVFMCIGNINRLSKNNQDFKRMGIYYKLLPIECFFTFLGLINLCGLPFTLGFYIKHFLFLSLNFNFVIFYISFIFALFGALTGLFYSFRIFFFSFFDFKKSKKQLYLNYNSKILNSNFFSNSTLFSSFSIFSIFFFSYLINFIFLNKFFSNSFSFSDFLNFNFINSNFFIFVLPFNILLNLNFINFIVFFFLIFIIFNN